MLFMHRHHMERAFSSMYCRCTLHIIFVMQLGCITHMTVLLPGINQEGLFRVNGNARIVERLRTSFEQSGDAILDATSTDVMSVAALLKLFLRELPEGVVPQANTKRFVHAHQSQ